MSLVVQTFTAGNALTANPASTSSGASTGETTAAIPFAQALVQTMGGSTGKSASAPLFGNLASMLQGMLNAVLPSGEEQANAGSQNTEDSQHSDLLGGLEEGIGKLDEFISNDPALLSALQGWLLQVSALLPGYTAEAAGTETAESLSPLAQNPETVRFAVQDDLNSLVTVIQNAVADGNEEVAAKGVALLSTFSSLLQQFPLAENKTSAKVPVVTNTTTGDAEALVKGNSLPEQSLPGETITVPKDANTPTPPGTTAPVEQTAGIGKPSKPVETVLPNSNNRLGNVIVPKNEVLLTSSGITVPAGEAEPEVLNMPAAKAIIEAAVKKTDSVSQNSNPEGTALTEDHEVVTVGQLSLRNGITAPLKAEVPKVPVQHFAQEITSFITGKLEIVKKGGVAEATISLFPDNLGQVDVKITMQNGHVVAQFLTEHAAAKDMLEQQMTQLRAALQSQGLQVEKLEVTQNNTPLQSQLNQEGRQPGSGGQSSNRRSKERQEDIGDAVLAAELNGEWKEWARGSAEEHENQNGSFSAKA